MLLLALLPALASRLGSTCASFGCDCSTVRSAGCLAREAVYPWYVLHQSLMLLFAWQLLLHLGPVVQPVLILAGIIGGCARLHEFVIRRTRWLRPLFGLDAQQGGASAIATSIQMADGPA
jgi:hypothetical protein